MFHHMDKRPVFLEALPTIPLALDLWKGPRRDYWLFRAFVETVAIQAPLSGYNEEGAFSLLQPLAPFGPGTPLAKWRADKTVRVMGMTNP